MKTEFVHYMPELLQDGVLYYSKEFGLVIHLCACGCKGKTVTPVEGAYKWDLVLEGDLITLSPSIGNFSMPCKSHYFIRQNQVVWC